MRERLGLIFGVVLVLGAGAFLGSALSRWRTTPDGPEAVETDGPVVGRVRVEVLNAGGKDGMARLATDWLRDRGFDVVYLGNAPQFDRDSSVVLARGPESPAASQVARALEIVAVRSEPDSSRYVDVSVLLGKDWGPPGSAGAGDGEEAHQWWDIRRLWRREGT